MSKWCFFFFWMTASLYAHEVVLITGATQGIGLETAITLASKGYVVYGTYRVNSDLREFHKASAQNKEHMFKVLMDVSDTQSVTRAVDEVIQKEGKIDVLINNAAIALYGSWESTSIEQAERIFDVNYFGPTRLIQTVLPYMRHQKKGHIINLSSRAAFRPVPCLSVYSASKAALFAACETLAASAKVWNIKVSCIEPGPVQTHMDTHLLYANRFRPGEDPYFPLFEAAALTMENSIEAAQPISEVVEVIVKAIESPHPHFRYQTHSLVKKQAALRSRDITGEKGLKELEKGFYTK